MSDQSPTPATAHSNAMKPDVQETIYLFQVWNSERGWSRGEQFDDLQEALAQHEDFYSIRNRASRFARIVAVTTTIAHRLIDNNGN